MAITEYAFDFYYADGSSTVSTSVDGIVWSVPVAGPFGSLQPDNTQPDNPLELTWALADFGIAAVPTLIREAAVVVCRLYRPSPPPYTPSILSDDVRIPDSAGSTVDESGTGISTGSRIIWYSRCAPGVVQGFPSNIQDDCDGANQLPVPVVDRVSERSDGSFQLVQFVHLVTVWLTFHKPRCLGLTCNNPPYGLVGVLYSHTFTAACAAYAYTFSIAAGALPDGLTLNPDSGLVYGWPTIPGLFEFTVEVLDDDGNTAQVDCSILITRGIQVTLRGIKRVRKPAAACEPEPQDAPEAPKRGRVL